MDTSSELREAVCQFQKGGKKAFDDIYRMSYGYLFVCVSRLIGNEDNVYDILQEVYLEICKSIGQLKQPELFLAWAARIAYRKCLAWLKKERRLPVAEKGQTQDYLEEVAETEEFLPETILQDKEKRRLLREIIDALPPIRKECIVAFYYYELTIQQIAEELELPLNTVKSHLNRGRKEIRAAVLELEEQKGTRLYAAAPFFLLLLGMEAEACQVPEMPRQLSGVKGAGLSCAGRAGAAILAAVVCVTAGVALYQRAGEESSDETYVGRESSDETYVGRESSDETYVGEDAAEISEQGSSSEVSESESSVDVLDPEDTQTAEEGPSYEVSLQEYLGLQDMYPWLGAEDVPMMATDDFLFVYTGVTDQGEDSYIVYFGNNGGGTPTVTSTTEFKLYNGETGERLLKPYVDEEGRTLHSLKGGLLPTKMNEKRWFRVLIDRSNQAYDPDNIVIAQMMFSPEDTHAYLREEIENANFIWGYRPKGTISDVLDKINVNNTPFVFLPDGSIWWFNGLSEYAVNEMGRLERYYQVESLTGDTPEHLLEELESHMKLGRIVFSGGVNEEGVSVDIAVEIDAGQVPYSIDISQVRAEEVEDSGMIIGPFVVTGDKFLPEDTVTGWSYVLGYDDGENIWYFW